MELDLGDSDAESAEEVGDGGEAGVLAPFGVVGAPDPGAVAGGEPLVEASAALFAQGGQGGLLGADVEGGEDARVGAAVVLDGRRRLDVVAGEDAVGVEQGARQARVVPEDGVVQLRAGGDMELASQSEGAGAGDAAQLQLEASARLLGLGVAQERVVAQGAVDDVAVGADVVAGGADVRPVDVGGGDDGLDVEAGVEGALVGVDDVGGLRGSVEEVEDAPAEEVDAEKV